MFKVIALVFMIIACACAKPKPDVLAYSPYVSPLASSVYSPYVASAYSAYPYAYSAYSAYPYASAYSAYASPYLY